MNSRLTAWLKIESDELRPLAWSFFYFFSLLCAYYILRPVRDEMAIEGGVQHLPWLMTGTFLMLLAATPLFGWLTARLPRRRFLPIVYLFFAAHLLIFYLLAQGHVHPAWVARAFFIWLSVFNLFVVSVFWSFMVDVFSPAQGKRLFGIIAAGGSAGALIGPVITAVSTYVFPVANLMAIAAALLLVCLWCIRQLDGWTQAVQPAARQEEEKPLGGQVLGGIRAVTASPYLAGISGYLLVLTGSATFLYLEQAQVIGLVIASPAERTRLYAGVDFTVSVLTFLTQLLVTNRVGLSAALLTLPAASLVGFILLGMSQTVGLFVALIVVRRVSEYALAKPGREVLFTRVSREEKYKAKNFIDTAISRGGDAASGWLVAGAKSLGATTAGLIWFMVPALLLWCWLASWLAKQAERSPATPSGLPLPAKKSHGIVPRL